MTQARQESYRGRVEEEEQVDDEVSSCEETKVQKRLVKELVDNPRFMTEARWKELEPRQRQKEESTPVVKEEERTLSLFPYHRHRSESAAAMQQPTVKQEQQVQGASAVPPPPSEGSPPSKATGSPSKAIGSPSKPNNAPSNRWFIGGLKWVFSARQLPTAQSSPTRHRSTKSTKAVPLRRLVC